MSYSPPSLPPISTLSAALENGDNSSMIIAPELMGEEGEPPTIKRRSSEAGLDGTDVTGEPSHGINNNGYQSSSARDEHSGYGTGGGGYSHGGGRHQHPWEEGYRDQHDSSIPDFSQPQVDNADNANPGEGNKDENGNDGDKPKPRKRARVSKPRQSKDGRNGGVKDDGIPEEGILDYADPSGDFKLGPVYVHPPKGAAQACVRCHKIKRKCDNARPRCAGCSKADVACVFELSPATASYVTSLKSDNVALTSQIASAAERIHHLESAISNMERGLPPPAERNLFEDENDQFLPSSLSTQADFAAISKTILSVRSNELSSPVFGGPATIGNSKSGSATQTPFGNASHAGQSPLPPYDEALQAVETFFVMNALSYPFLDREEFMRDMDEIYRQDQSGSGRRGSTFSSAGHRSSEEAETWAGKEFVFFMVIAIGTTNRERLGEVEKGSSKTYKERAFSSLQAAVGKEDILCVQSLILLGIYAMFDPSGISLWHVVGFAARVAISLNLHRRVDDSALPASTVEHRKRVFYSLFNLDRLVAVTLSKPLAIADDDIDVGLPSPLPNDAPFRGRPRIEFTQHIIKLRRLGGEILSTVYSVSGAQNTRPEAERAEMISRLHRQFDNWLNNCPAPPPDAEEENRGMIHTSHSWFLLNYHQGICLLYRPSPLYPTMTQSRLASLHEASVRCVDLYIDLWQERKVSYNLINVSMQFLACISLLYCLCEFDNRDSNLVNNSDWRVEVEKRLNQCHELLEAFSSALPETAKYREIFTKLSGLLLARYGPLQAQAQQGSDNALHSFDKIAIPPVPTSDDIAAAITNSTSASLPGSAIAGDSSNTAAGENEVAWNAMTQLWYNSGEFVFDERALSTALNPYINQNQNQQQNQVSLGGGVMGEDAKERDLGSAKGLWHQLG
ncbi:uncharacterized protein I303_101267 [Kwoniella dejecticola CBS 10117]|uniref:Zn(2)-C6 fungal-type domain-containing protein n=1 Tax=Kwoniella dejecticola CBS 10117 TaxID=1296121 RepID=A0A1A6AH99_9TREE|nr:uncharacterized protein I303_01274 [Kwoniella dejecticola CBS 10117]OBR89447.1 hypothetical protein I303_01274 [Kwoniella dejecticola CBS 10117]